jgi:transcriptional regulator with XRE-family HTH domain
MNLRELRIKRIANRIPAVALASRSAISAGRLSELERGLVAPGLGDAEQLAAALEELVEARRKTAKFAAKVGWPMAL